MHTSHACRTIDSMPAHARLWVYKAPRALSEAEQRMVRERGAAFTGEWSAHGAPLDACVDVVIDRYVLIAVDEDQARASGCSIDRSVAFIRTLEHELQLTLTDRMVVAYEKDGQVHGARLQELERLEKAGEVTRDTLVFDDLVATVGAWRERFKVPLHGSWMARFL
jgi:hypothetical protein